MPLRQHFERGMFRSSLNMEDEEDVAKSEMDPGTPVLLSDFSASDSQ